MRVDTSPPETRRGYAVSTSSGMGREERGRDGGCRSNRGGDGLRGGDMRSGSLSGRSNSSRNHQQSSSSRSDRALPMGVPSSPETGGRGRNFLNNNNNNRRSRYSSGEQHHGERFSSNSSSSQDWSKERAFSQHENRGYDSTTYTTRGCHDSSTSVAAPASDMHRRSSRSRSGGNGGRRHRRSSSTYRDEHRSYRGPADKNRSSGNSGVTGGEGRERRAEEQHHHRSGSSRERTRALAHGSGSNSRSSRDGVGGRTNTATTSRRGDSEERRRLDNDPVGYEDDTHRRSSGGRHTYSTSSKYSSSGGGSSSFITTTGGRSTTASTQRRRTSSTGRGGSSSRDGRGRSRSSGRGVRDRDRSSSSPRRDRQIEDPVVPVYSRIVVLRGVPETATEEEVEEKARNIAISKGFSVPNAVAISQVLLQQLQRQCGISHSRFTTREHTRKQRHYWKEQEEENDVSRRNDEEEWITAAYIEFPSSEAAAKFRRWCKNTPFHLHDHQCHVDILLETAVASAAAGQLNLNSTSQYSLAAGGHHPVGEWTCVQCGTANSVATAAASSRNPICAACCAPCCVLQQTTTSCESLVKAVAAAAAIGPGSSDMNGEAAGDVLGDELDDGSSNYHHHMRGHTRGGMSSTGLGDAVDEEDGGNSSHRDTGEGKRRNREGGTTVRRGEGNIPENHYPAQEGGWGFEGVQYPSQWLLLSDLLGLDANDLLHAMRRAARKQQNSSSLREEGGEREREGGGLLNIQRCVLVEDDVRDEGSQRRRANDFMLLRFSTAEAALAGWRCAKSLVGKELGGQERPQVCGVRTQVLPKKDKQALQEMLRVVDKADNNATAGDGRGGSSKNGSDGTNEKSTVYPITKLQLKDLQDVAKSSPKWDLLLQQFQGLLLPLGTNMPPPLRHVDRSSGYYYDASIDLYLDPSTQYYMTSAGDYYIHDTAASALRRVCSYADQQLQLQRQQQSAATAADSNETGGVGRGRKQQQHTSTPNSKRSSSNEDHNSTRGGERSSRGGRSSSSGRARDSRDRGGRTRGTGEERSSASSSSTRGAALGSDDEGEDGVKRGGTVDGWGSTSNHSSKGSSSSSTSNTVDAIASLVAAAQKTAKATKDALEKAKEKKEADEERKRQQRLQELQKLQEQHKLQLKQKQALLLQQQQLLHQQEQQQQQYPDYCYTEAGNMESTAETGSIYGNSSNTGGLSHGFAQQQQQLEGRLGGSNNNGLGGGGSAAAVAASGGVHIIPPPPPPPPVSSHASGYLRADAYSSGQRCGFNGTLPAAGTPSGGFSSSAPVHGMQQSKTLDHAFSRDFGSPGGGAPSGVDAVFERGKAATASNNNGRLAGADAGGMVRAGGGRGAAGGNINDCSTQSKASSEGEIVNASTGMSASNSSAGDAVTGVAKNYCCYLCLRQFRSAEDLSIHEEKSQLHAWWLKQEEGKKHDEEIRHKKAVELMQLLQLQMV